MSLAINTGSARQLDKVLDDQLGAVLKGMEKNRAGLRKLPGAAHEVYENTEAGTLERRPAPRPSTACRSGTRSRFRLRRVQTRRIGPG
ncbi:hypothetical protein GCM10023342_30810 [Modicisalibacter zincidurans]|uniref:Uncharacterized protein n=1 Tax=Modicisalibacter zincidurans TaxID=1178777 RepID=A0ABP9RK16_9GAMM